jgi:hypothetical protein
MALKAADWIMNHSASRPGGGAPLSLWRYNCWTSVPRTVISPGCLLSMHDFGPPLFRNPLSGRARQETKLSALFVVEE